jgi:uncharacterized membrane protein
MSSVTTRKLLAFTSVVEVGTGVLVIVAPAIVVRLLVGLEIAADGTLLARCFGIALIALALACWPGERVDSGSSAFRAMLTYNALIALYVGYLGAFEHLSGLLLWPAVVLHALVALLLPWSLRPRAS